MKISAKHILLIAGMLTFLLSFLFFGRSQGIYQLLLVSGILLSVICFVWIIFGRGTIKEKLFWAGAVAFGIILNWLTENYLINTSYRIYLNQHEQELASTNEILKDKPGEIWILQDSVTEKGAQVLSYGEKERLLQERKKLGVYLIYKSDSTIYYGLWGFLDVRIGLTYSSAGKQPGSQYQNLTGNWYH